MFFSKCLAVTKCTFLALLFLSADPALADKPLLPKEMVRRAVEYWRDDSSRTLAEMTVHRSDWERTLTMQGWTKGIDNSLIRFVKPVKDAGNASLTIDKDIWSFSPKINKVIKIPPSMKSQSWMGSDFSYRDLARSDDIVDEYEHRLLGTEVDGSHLIYIVEAIPHDLAPVVWGKEILKIRNDYIFLMHEFYDQDGKLVKRLTATDIQPLGGKLYPTRMRMQKIEEQDEWTEIHTVEAEFGSEIPDSFFTLSNLRNPRRGQ